MHEVPNNWKIKPLSKLVRPDKPIVYGIVQAGPHYPGGIPYIKSSDVGSRIDASELSCTSPEIAGRYTRSIVQPGDIVFSLRGNIGELSIVQETLPEANLTQGTARISVNGEILNEFLAFALQSPLLQRRIAVVGKGSTFREISLDELRKLEIPVPPLCEQRKIGAILRTWDEAIEKLEALRTAKSRRLTGLFQKLLGWGEASPEYWEVRPLSAISTRIRRQNGGVDYPVMTISAKSGFLMQSDKFSRDMAGSSVERYIVLHEGEFAYNKGNSLTAPYGCIFPLDRPAALVPFVYFCFALDERLNRQFYMHLFAAGALNHQLSRLINYGVRNDGLLNLNADDFFNCKVPLPPSDEQRAIAAALSTAKKEIELFDSKIDALTLQKRGLMQKLLSGEWRVNVDKNAEAAA
jgi:type I restriction enzyme, S subunit